MTKWGNGFLNYGMVKIDFNHSLILSTALNFCTPGQPLLVLRTNSPPHPGGIQSQNLYSGIIVTSILSYTREFRGQFYGDIAGLFCVSVGRGMLGYY